MGECVPVPKFSANLSIMFQEVPFLERFGAAARVGFKAVEFMFPYEYAIADLQQALSGNGLQLVLINLPAGNFAAGERGIAVNPVRQEEFREGVSRAIEYARALGVPQINCLVGRTLPDVPVAEQRQALTEAHLLLDQSGVHLAQQVFAKADD